MRQRHSGSSELYRARVTMAALNVMAEAFNNSLGRLTMSSRQKANVAFARQIAMYLSHIVGQLSMREVSIEFEREPSTVVYACQAIEELRDKPIFERQMQFLEEALHERIVEIRADLKLRGFDFKDYDGDDLSNQCDNKRAISAIDKDQPHRKQNSNQDRDHSFRDPSAPEKKSVSSNVIADRTTTEIA
ncbi:MAG: helix-turn-helix domain-containing protein [Pseudomonadota bacterium]